MMQGWFNRYAMLGLRMKERLQSRRLQWFRYLGRIEEGAYPSECGTLNVRGSLSREWSEWKGSQQGPNYRQKSLEVICRNFQSMQAWKIDVQTNVMVINGEKNSSPVWVYINIGSNFPHVKEINIDRNSITSCLVSKVCLKLH